VTSNGNSDFVNRAILPDFIQIRFETTEPWGFLKTVAPEEEEEEDQQQQQHNNNNKMSSDMRSVPVGSVLDFTSDRQRKRG